ncbi:MAG: LOG family protein [Planctomycetota bacterium]
MTEHNRGELDPIEADAATEPLAGAESERVRRADDDAIQQSVNELIRSVAGDALADDRDGRFRLRLVRELITAGLKLIPDGRDTGELKLMTAATKELRYALRVFGRYAEPHKVTIFGSARTPETDPDFEHAVEFSREMAERGWMVITGAGDGIMKAGHVGPGREGSFGVAIRLPFETTANDVIAGDEKLIHFRYFFTRKLMFLSQAEAVALYPGGFGTMDELFETLTLIQTGKASMVPVVLIEHEGGRYWETFDRFVRDELLDNRLISAEDTGLYYITRDAKDAAEHVSNFYRVYHSSRYVKDDLIIRLKSPLSERAVVTLNEEFASLVREGEIVQRGPYDIEDEHLDLPRLAFTHTRHAFGLVRKLIDRINELGAG